MEAGAQTRRRPRLLQQARERLRALHYSYRTEQAYVHWIRFFIRYSGMRRPREMGWVVAIEWAAVVMRAERSERVPVVLTHDEVAAVLARLCGRFWLMASLMYGAGLGVVGGGAVRSPMDALGVAAGAPSLAPNVAGGGPGAVASES